MKSYKVVFYGSWLFTVTLNFKMQTCIVFQTVSFSFLADKCCNNFEKLSLSD